MFLVFDDPALFSSLLQIFEPLAFATDFAFELYFCHRRIPQLPKLLVQVILLALGIDFYL